MSMSRDDRSGTPRDDRLLLMLLGVDIYTIST
jgi:hypothetical protein